MTTDLVDRSPQRVAAELSADRLTLIVTRTISWGCPTEPTAFTFDGDTSFAVTFEFVSRGSASFCYSVGGAVATRFALPTAPTSGDITVEYRGPNGEVVELSYP